MEHYPLPYIMAGNSHPELFQKLEKELQKISPWENLTLGKCTIEKFSDGEPRVVIGENIRGKTVYILQSTCKTPNGNTFGENFVELCVMSDACMRNEAGKIIIVNPYYGLCRQDKAKDREPISASWVAKVLKVSGANRIISFDLHAEQIQGFFDGSFGHIFARPVLQEAFSKIDHHVEKVFVSPDTSGAERARKFAAKFNAPIAIIDKRREKPNEAEALHLIGDVKNKLAVIIDDLIDTAGTLMKGISLLIENDAVGVIAIATHGVLSGKAVQRINESQISKVIITDTIPLSDEGKACQKIEVASIANFLAKVIKYDYFNFSLKSLFENK